MKTDLPALREEANVLRLLNFLMLSEVPLLEALFLTAHEYPFWREPLIAMHIAVVNGGELKDGLKDYPDKFSAFVPELLSAGINSGSLDLTFRLASHIVDTHAELIQAGVSKERIAEVTFLLLLGASVGNLGTPILQALRLAGRGGIPSEVVDEIVNDVKCGNTLTGSLKKDPRFFDESTIIAIGMAEQMGTVPEICASLAEIKVRKYLQESGLGHLPSLPSEAAQSDFRDYQSLALMGYAMGDIRPKTLELLLKQGILKNPGFVELSQKMKGGQSLALAMKSMPLEFPPYIARVLVAAEEEGSLLQTLALVVDHLQWINFRVGSSTFLNSMLK